MRGDTAMLVRGLREINTSEVLRQATAELDENMSA